MNELRSARGDSGNKIMWIHTGGMFGFLDRSMDAELIKQSIAEITLTESRRKNLLSSLNRFSLLHYGASWSDLPQVVQGTELLLVDIACQFIIPTFPQ